MRRRFLGMAGLALVGAVGAVGIAGSPASATLLGEPILNFVSGKQVYAISPQGEYAVISNIGSPSGMEVINVTYRTSIPGPSISAPTKILVSDNGTTLWVSTTQALSASDTDTLIDVYRYDLPSTTPTLLTGGLDAAWNWEARDVSNSGSVLALYGNGAGQEGAFRYDGATLQRPDQMIGPDAPNPARKSSSPTLSSDGSRLSYLSWDADGCASCVHAYVYILSTNSNQTVDITSFGTPANGNAANPMIDGLGRYVAFETNATDLKGAGGFRIAIAELYNADPSESNIKPVSGGGSLIGIGDGGDRVLFRNGDLYLWDRQFSVGEPRSLIVSTTNGTSSSVPPGTAALSSPGARIVFASSDPGLGAGAGTTDLFVRNIPPTQYGSRSPARLLDTRPGGSTADGKRAGEGLRQPGQKYELPVVGRAGVSGAPAAVVLNVTVTGTTGGGFLTVWPCDTAAPPNTSNLNYEAGSTVANAVIVGLSASGTVCLQASNAGTHVIVDVSGVFPPGLDYRSVSPERLLDTRSGAKSAAGARIDLPVWNRGGVPTSAKAAVLNVTVTQPDGPGFVTVWPCDTTTPPNASNLNFYANQTVPNLVVAPISPSGTVCLQSSESATHLLADVMGYISGTSTYTPRSPFRLMDTRLGGDTPDDQFQGIGTRSANTRVELPIRGRADTPALASAAILNVTVTGPSTNGYLTVWPCDTPTPPNASNLNYGYAQTVPNLVIASLSSTGTVCLQSSEADAEMIVDLNGWITS